MIRRSLTPILLAILFVAVVLWVRHHGVREAAPVPSIVPRTQTASAPASTGPFWVGFASSHKAGPYLSGADVYVDLPGDRWPPEIEGKRIVVTGTPVVRYDLPVFIAGDPVPGAVQADGIPVPKGTDLHKASRRVVIENARWTLEPE